MIFFRPGLFRNIFPAIVLLTLAVGSHAEFQIDLETSSAACQLSSIIPASRKFSVRCVYSKLPPGRIKLQFRDRTAGVDNLSTRIYQLRVRDNLDRVLPLEIRGSGLYFFNPPVNSQPLSINYEMRLERPLDPSQYALTSSLGKDAGVIFPADVFPRLSAAESEDTGRHSLRLRIAPPDGWSILTVEEMIAGEVLIEDCEKSVLLIGKWRTNDPRAGDRAGVTAALTGEWSLNDEQILRQTQNIARSQFEIMGGRREGKYVVAILPYPLPLTGLRSSGIAVGRTAILMLNPNDDPKQTFTHLQRHLAHEMFHLYLPNAFRVRENFDWFWEGFTRYIALLTLARQGGIGMREYLDAVTDEYEAYSSNPSRTRDSMVDASPEKFASPESHDLVYRKGMLVAALYDWQLRWQTKGKKNVADVMRTLYQIYSVQDREIGNAEVLETLRSAGNFNRLIKDDIEGTREIRFAQRAAEFDLKVEPDPSKRGRPRLVPTKKFLQKQAVLFPEM